MRNIESFQLISEGIGYTCYIIFVTYHHQSVTQLNDHIRRRQQVDTRTTDACDGSMILLTEIKGTYTFSVALRPCHSDTTGDEVSRFLGLHMQVVVLQRTQQTQHTQVFLIRQYTYDIAVGELRLLLDQLIRTIRTNHTTHHHLFHRAELLQVLDGHTSQLRVIKRDIDANRFIRSVSRLVSQPFLFFRQLNTKCAAY